MFKSNKRCTKNVQNGVNFQPVINTIIVIDFHIILKTLKYKSEQIHHCVYQSKTV